MNRINPSESDFVKDKRKNHCKGCRNERGYCSACAVLNCWLRKTYLPKGEWERASMDDTVWKNVNKITNEIDKKIMKELSKNEIQV